MRPSSLNLLFSSIHNIKGVGQKTVPLLSNLFDGDLLIYALFHKPTGLICRQKVDNVIQLKAGNIPIFKVKILEHTKPYSKKAPYRILCEISSLRGALLEIAFFNYHKNYLIDLLPVGEERLISGQVEWYNNVLQMTHPDYIVELENEWKIPLFEPIYPLTQGISNKIVRFVIKEALKAIPDNLPEWLDETLIKRERWTSFKQSLIDLHDPKSPADLEDTNKARQRLAYDEIMASQTALLLMRTRMKKMTGNAWHGTGALTARLKSLLPFELTGAQKRVMSEIFSDLKSTDRMNRLLQGDV
ncbi:MAG: ATP-dependent DNA helicase RecG, partial [Alphaproteobacteria bacterium]